MKKFLKVMTLLAAMALTSCGAAGKGSTSGAPKTSGTSQAAHIHTYDESKWEKDAEQHWHPATCEHTSAKGSAAAHTFVADTSKQDVPATCSTPGKKYEKCSVCGYEKVTELPTLEHDWEKVKDYAEETGYSKTAQYKCKLGDHYAIRWAALSYTEAVNVEENGASADNPNSVRLKTAQYDNSGSAEEPGTTVGSKLVYKFKSGAAVAKAGFAFNAVLKYGSGAPAPLFDAMSGDQQKGWIDKPDGTKELATKRYQLKVNNQVVEIGEDKKYGDEITGVKGEPHWYDWPVEFPVQAGDNTVEILCLGGYRAYLYDFQVTGLPQNA